jgi:simple sugar transport system permease protein
MMINSNPLDLSGKEMMVIAAVVIGGARITGGHGSLTGTMLGVSLVTIMSNSLILIGIPSFWQRFVTGLIILIGTGITAYQAKRMKKQLNVEVAD